MKIIIVFSVLVMLASTAVASGIERIGTTFSIYQCEYLGMDWKQAYRQTLDMGWDLIRIGVDWERVEKADGVFDFSDIDWQLGLAREKGVPVILALGMKTPRWPEFHVPKWLWEKVKKSNRADVSEDQVFRKKTLIYISTVILRYLNDGNIKYWQVENEALNRFGEGYKYIGRDFLEEEVKLVRELDTKNRPILLTAATYPNKFLELFSFLTVKHDPVKEILQLCDIVGFNIYPTVGKKFMGVQLYFRTTEKERIRYFHKLQTKVKFAGKESWIVELQAEPWEPGKLVYLDKEKPKTGRAENIVYYVLEFKGYGFNTILLWGIEYWIYREKKYDDTSYLDAVSKVLTLN